MRTDAEAAGAQWTQGKDSRVTKVGAFLRKTRLDELPQFWAVVKCGKSFVSRSVQAMLERFWAKSKDPETRFFDEGPAARARQAVIPAAAAVFRERIDDMKAIFADEDRSDWFDADDVARDIAESLDLLLAAQGF